MNTIFFIVLSLLLVLGLTGNVVVGNGNNVSGNNNVIRHGDGNNIQGNRNQIEEGFRNAILGNLNSLFRTNNLQIEGDCHHYGSKPASHIP